jgi:hypothetical protein
MSSHLLVRSSLRAHAPEIPRRACSAISFISGLRLNKTSPLGGKTELTPIFFYEALFVPQTDTDYDAESIASIRAWATLAFRRRRKRRWSGRRAHAWDGYRAAVVSQAVLASMSRGGPARVESIEICAGKSTGKNRRLTLR